MALVDRDHELERTTLERVARIAGEPAFPETVSRRLDQVETAGGPDGGGVTTAAAAFTEAQDEYVDGPAWTLLGLQLLAAELAHGKRDHEQAVNVRLIVEEAMAHAAHAAHLMRGVLELL